MSKPPAAYLQYAKARGKILALMKLLTENVFVPLEHGRKCKNTLKTILKAARYASFNGVSESVSKQRDLLVLETNTIKKCG